MKLNLTMLALSLGFCACTAGAQVVDMGPDATSYRRFLLYPHLEKGFEAMSLGNRVRALAEFEQALALSPKNPTIAIYLAEAYRFFGEPARAEAVLREQLSQNPGDPGLRKAIAITVVPDKDLVRQSAKNSRSALVPAEVTSKAATGPVVDSPKPGASSVPVRPGLSLASKSARRPSNAALAYGFADKSYKDSASGNHAEAADAARQAVRLAPANRSYRAMLVYELMEINQFEEADEVAFQKLPRDNSTKDSSAEDELKARQKLVREHIAFRHFDAANAALATGNTGEATASARKSIIYAPRLMPYRLQLISVLLAAQKWSEAEQSASDAIRDLSVQPALLVLRAYALQRSGQRLAAAADLDAALAEPGLNAKDQQNLRLIAADAALAAGEPQKALDVLAPLAAAPSAVEGVTNRRAAALKLFYRRVSYDAATASTWLTPRVNCGGALYSAFCEVQPGENPPDPAYPVADAAYKAFSAQNYELAVTKAQEAVALSPNNLQYRTLLINALVAADQFNQADQAATDFLSSVPDDGEMLVLRSNLRQRMGQPTLAAADAEAALRSENLPVSSEISMLIQLDRKLLASERFAAALREGAFIGQAQVDTAYLALRVKDDATAMTAFDQAIGSNALPDSALQDAAYVAGRLGRTEESVAYFKRAIDASEAGQLPLEPQQLFNARRSIADRSRNSGVYGSFTYRGVTPSGLSLTPGATNDSLQSGLEAYWRPYNFGDGRLVELYGGLAGTLYSKSSGLATGAPSVVGALGARVKPLGDTNLILALERRLGIGSKANTDWLARLGYSWSQGLDLRVNAPDWLTAQVYAETGRFIKLKQNYATFEGQAGRSFRLDSIQPKLVIFPHLVLGADRNTGYEKDRQKAVGAGVGTSLRYWFNEDKYTAPQSYWDLSLQYRGRISGDERAKGTFVRFTLSY